MLLFIYFSQSKPIQFNKIQHYIKKMTESNVPELDLFHRFRMTTPPHASHTPSNPINEKNNFYIRNDLSAIKQSLQEPSPLLSYPPLYSNFRQEKIPYQLLQKKKKSYIQYPSNKNNLYGESTSSYLYGRKSSTSIKPNNHQTLSEAPSGKFNTENNVKQTKEEKTSIFEKGNIYPKKLSSIPEKQEQFEFKKSPTTYLEQVEKYLATGNLKFSIHEKANSFPVFDKEIDNPLQQQFSKNAYISEQHKKSLNKNILKKVNRQRQELKEQMPSKYPYMNNNDTERNNLLPIFVTNLQKIAENKSIIEEQSLKKQNLSKAGEASQVSPEKVKKSSIIIDKLLHKIPEVLDKESFRKLINAKFAQFHNIRLQLDEEPSIIDFDDLFQTKEQYMNSSRNLLRRLNELVGENKQLSLVMKLLQHKQQKQIFWPQI